MLSGQAKSGDLLKGLSQEYKVSLSIIAGRLKEIKSLIKENTLISTDPLKDPEVIYLKERLKPLNYIYLDLQEVAKEVNLYYNRSHWRSEKLTMNAKKAKRQYYCSFTYND
jgi:hypothetical protein